MKDPRHHQERRLGLRREAKSEVFIANSLGLLKSYRASGCSFGVSVVAEKGDQKSSGGEYCSRRFFADLKTPEEVAAKAARKAYETLDPKMVKTQKAAVIFDPDVAGALLGGILAAINGERVLQEASFLGRMLNQKIASDLLTVIDDGTPSERTGFGPVRRRRRHDPEPPHHRGRRPQGLPLQHDHRQESRGQKHRQRLARRLHRRFRASARTTSTLSPGAAKPEDIIKATKTGLLLKEVTGYGINPVNGQFSGGASGFWIENGKIAFPVIGLTIAGSAEEMFNGIDMVADDLDLNRGTAAPTFRIKLMQIGGE